MARFVKNLGTIPMRYQFDITVHKVILNVPFKVNAALLLKRGPKLVDSKQQPELDKGKNVAEFNETLSVLVTVQKDKKKGIFKEKMATIILKIKKEDKYKNIGKISFNLAHVLDDQISGGQRKTAVFEKCPDKEATIEYSVSNKLISENIAADSISQYSDNLSIASGPESEFEFEDFEKQEETKQSIRQRFGGAAQGRKPAAVLSAHLKKFQIDRNRPPAYGGQHILQNAPNALDPNSIIQGIEHQEILEQPIEEEVQASKDIFLQKQQQQKMAERGRTKEVKGLSLEQNTQDAELSQSSQQQQEQSQLKRSNSKVFKKGAIKFTGATQSQINNQEISVQLQGNPVMESQQQLQKEEDEQFSQQKQLLSNAPSQKNILDKIKSQHQPTIVAPNSQIYQQVQLQKKIEALETEKQKLVEDYKLQLDQLLKEKESQLQSSTKLENNIHKLEAERDKLQLKVNQTEQQLQKLKQKSDELQTDNQKLAQIVREGQEKTKQLEDNLNKEAKLQAQKSKEIQEQNEKELQDLKQRMKEKDKQLKSAEDEIESLSENIEKLRSQLVEIRQSSISTQSQIEQNLKEKIAKMDREIEELKKDQRGKQSRIEELQGKVEQVEQYDSQLKFDLEKIRIEKEKSQELLKKVQQNEKDLQKNVELLQSQLKGRENQYQVELDELKRQLEQSEVEKKSLEKQIKDKDKKISSLESKVMDLEENKLQQFSEYQEDLESQKNRYELQIMDLKKRIQELEEKCEEMKKQATQLQQQQQSIRQQSKSPIRSKEQSKDKQQIAPLNNKKGKNEQDIQQQYLLDEIKKLQDELINKEEEHYLASANLKEENSRLQKQMQMDKQRSKSSANDRELAKISLENELLKKQIEELESKVKQQYNKGQPSATTKPLSKIDNNIEKDQMNNQNESEASFLKEKMKQLRDENLQFNSQVKTLASINEHMEKDLVEAKLRWAELDMENEDLAFKLKQKCDQLKIFSAQVTKLEIELVKSKQDLGEALNAVYEYEQMQSDSQLITQMESNLTFKEGIDKSGIMDENNDKGSSKTEKLKNFFKKKLNK